MDVNNDEEEAIDRLFNESKEEKPIILPKDHTPTNVVFKAMPLPKTVMNVQMNNS